MDLPHFYAISVTAADAFFRKGTQTKKEPPIPRRGRAVFSGFAVIILPRREPG